MLADDAEDTVRYAVPGLPSGLDGDMGADRITAEGASDDILDGGQGNDFLAGGNGDDKFDSADGVAEKVQCGPGNDTAAGDQLDEFVDCETVDRRTVAPPNGDDRVAPKLTAAALTSQRLERRRVKVVATSSEKGSITASGHVAAGGIHLRLGSSAATVDVGGGGVEFSLKLSKRVIERARKDLERGRRPRIRLTLSAVDAAGNTSAARHLTIRLRR